LAALQSQNPETPVVAGLISSLRAGRP